MSKRQEEIARAVVSLTNCFGITKKAMTNYGLYIIIGAGGVTALEVIVLLIVCCVRKGNGESRPLL